MKKFALITGLAAMLTLNTGCVSTVVSTLGSAVAWTILTDVVRTTLNI